MASSTSTTPKSAALMEQMKLHLSTDAGKELIKKIGLVYQINIAPKVLLLYLSVYSIRFSSIWLIRFS